MSAQPKSYTRYGSFILFKKLEESSLAEVWRAATIEENTVGPHIALLRFTGGDTGALKRAAEQAAGSLRTIEGSTVVKGQTYHLVGRNPVITWDYEGGRSLFHMIEISRGSSQLPPNPFPLDQSLAIAEKLALSLETTGRLKHGGQRLYHGILLPQMVWISEDGDVRTLGHRLTRGVLASLNRAPVQKQFGGFVAPELGRNGEPTDPSEVWSIGANLYAMLTGNFLDPPTNQEAMNAVLADAALATDEPIPDPVRAVLTKSLAIDPAKRYESPADIREAINGLIQGEEYAPTTFNLAFYIHNLLREEIEAEAPEREAEKGVDPSLVPQAGAASEAPEIEQTPEETPPVASTGATFDPETGKARSGRLPLIAAAVVILLLAAGAAAYWFTAGPGGQPEEVARITEGSATPAETPPPPTRETAMAEPVVAVTDTGEEGVPVETTTAETDEPTAEELRQQMIQEEIDRRLQAEIMKLQEEYDRKLREERAKEPQRSQPKPEPEAPRKASTPTSPVTEAATPAVERPATTTTGAAESTSTAQPTSATRQATTSPQQPAAPAEPELKVGDLVEIGQVDTPPKMIGRVRPQYPRIAARQKAEATIFVSALVSENGDVLDVRVLRGDPRSLGFDEAAMEALRDASFQPAVKDGKRVKTWVPVPVVFKWQ
ncbi:MAG: TonB family protein [Thermoanaerobaculia bacterium]|nr:TonB family protein [Thermoanaerobaculia bacterium]